MHHLVERPSENSYASVNSSGAHPPPPGISRAFAHVLIPGVGHLKFYHCLGVGHLPTPGMTPGHLTPLSGFSLARGRDHKHLKHGLH